MPSKLPWDNVKAESLRSICGDLGRRLSTRAEMIAFLGKVEDEGLDAALAVEPPKRKAGRPPKEVSNANDEPESGHRAKRVRKSIGGPTTPVKSQREERAERRSPRKFDGVILPSRRKSARHEVAQESSGEEGNGEVSDADNNAEAGSTDEVQGVPKTQVGRHQNPGIADFEIALETGRSSGSDADKENAPIAQDADADADAYGEVEDGNPSPIAVDIPVDAAAIV